MVIPYICPEMPEAQRDGLADCVKVPLVYGTVIIRNWRALKSLGVSRAYCPGSCFSEVYIDLPVSMGAYRFTQSPDEPCVLHLIRVPTFPGLPLKDQYRAGHAERQLGPELIGSGLLQVRVESMISAWLADRSARSCRLCLLFR